MMEKKHRNQREFNFEGDYEQTLPLGELLSDLENEFDHEDEEEL